MDPQQVLNSIEIDAPTKGLPIIGPERGRFLDELVEKNEPQRILEVGTLVGYSAIRMARMMRKGKITCLEMNKDIAKVARSNIAAAGLSERVEILVGDANDLIPKLKGRFDMVFIDAEKKQYLSYLMKCEKLLNAGCVVVADNAKVFAREMADYLEYVRSSGKYKSSYREAPSGADAIEVSVKV